MITLPSDLRYATFSSRNGHPFVCFADISPDRGITFQGRQDKGGTLGAVAEYAGECAGIETDLFPLSGVK